MSTRTGPRRRAATLAGGALAALLALTACGEDSETSEEAESTTAETAAAASAAPEEAAAGMDTPEGAAAAFFDEALSDLIVTLLVDGDFTAAADIAEPYFCDEAVAEIRSTGEAMEAMSPEEREAALAEIGSLESDEFPVEYEILGSTEDGQTAVVEFELTSPHPLTGEITTRTTEFDMAEEAGEWQMCGAFF
jgi:hypothetical protein